MKEAFDLIKERLEEASFVDYDEHYTDNGECLVTISDAISIVSEVEAEYGNWWIPCSERLPEQFVHVLVWFEYFRYGEYNRLFQTHGISYTYKGEWSGFVNGSSGWQQLRIIAWMPLPEPYKPEEGV